MKLPPDNIEQLVSEALLLPPNAISYHVSQRLAALYHEKGIIEGDDISFDLESYAQAGLCILEYSNVMHNHVTVVWSSREKLIDRDAQNAWFKVTWQDEHLDVLLMNWSSSYCNTQYYWIIANTLEVAERFFQAVCEWNDEIRDEVLVFDSGYWQKSEELFQAIKDATFDNLVLHGTLKQDLQADLTRFFALHEMYETYGVPWKRGVLFVGPPGNGKTHAVKALINSLGKPCLYVKSFKSQHSTDNDNIRLIFKRARELAPCILVLEDLDSLVNDGNRSFFLNELDGFAANVGVVTLATTNHPDRLDPAILDRPSRFDRKYHFDLPGVAERLAYILFWNRTLQPALQLDHAGATHIAELTGGFSFAYLKELFITSVMAWINAPLPGAMAQVMAAQVGPLREQMASAPLPVPASVDESDHGD